MFSNILGVWIKFVKTGADNVAYELNELAFAFKSNAVCVDVDIGLFKSDVLSQFTKF